MQAQHDLTQAQRDLRHVESESVFRANKLTPVENRITSAVVVALQNPAVESRVVCCNPRDFYEVIKILSGKVYAMFDGKWDASDRALEFPNGSAVVVKFEEGKPR